MQTLGFFIAFVLAFVSACYLINAFLEVRYQHYQPFVLDSSAAQQTFGLAPTPLGTVLREMVAPR